MANTIMKASGEFRLANVSCRIPPKRTLTALGTVMGLLFLTLGSVSYGQTNLVTPAQYLALQQKPNFNPGTKLPLLGLCGPVPYSSTNAIAFTKGWGYALFLGDYNTLASGDILQNNSPWAIVNSSGFQGDMANSTTWVYQQIAYAKTNPSVKLQITIDNHMWPTNLSNGYWVTNSSGQFVDNSSNTWTGILGQSHTMVVSPEAASSDLSNQAAFVVSSFSSILSNAQIAIVLDTDESDLGVVNGDNAWQFDPRVTNTAVFTNPWPRISSYAPSSSTNGESWPDYISQKKGYQVSFIYNAIKTAVPNRQLFVFYSFNANEQSRFSQPGYAYWEDFYEIWGWSDKYIMSTNAQDLPSFQDYFQGADSYTNEPGATWSQDGDLLTARLDAIGYNFTIGLTNDYSWECGGWSTYDTNALANISTYTGFLKCAYTSGMVGAIAGYFSYPTNAVASTFGGTGGGMDSTFPTNTPPHWLLQIMALAHVHALFSHLDNFLYNGDLLSGPQSHVKSLDQPAYEFTNTAGYVNDRVLVRKLRGTNSWIVTAWAADGISNNVTVTIPIIGNLTVTAVPSASVYQVTMSGTNVQQTLLDEYTSYRPATVVGLRITSP